MNYTAWGAWLSKIPKVLCKVLSEYLYEYFKGETIHSTDQILKGAGWGEGLHDPKKVKNHIIKACIFRKIIVKHFFLTSLFLQCDISLPV